MFLIFFGQVFLHEPNDVPMVRDLGFVISPGVHALVGVQYSNVSIHMTNPTCSFYHLSKYLCGKTIKYLLNIYVKPL